MKCQHCESDRIAMISGKCGDMFSLSTTEAPRTLNDYVPDHMNIGGGDYIRISFCLDCGQIQGQWPVVDDHPALRELWMCPECGEDAHPDSDECGLCANCMTPLCLHQSKDHPLKPPRCPEEY